MLFKIIIILFLLLILFNLGSALFYLVKDRRHSKNMLRALGWRIGLSFALFILLFIAYQLRWIIPHGV